MIQGSSEYTPITKGESFIHPSSVIIGNVSLDEKVNVWPNAVLRGDVAGITVGRYTNIQDLCTIHVNFDIDTIIGSHVTVGHAAILHGCTVEDEVLIGMGSIILDGAYIEKNCIIGAGTLIPPGRRIPAGSLVLGSPGKVVRQLSQEEIENIRRSAIQYWENAVTFQKQSGRTDD